MAQDPILSAFDSLVLRASSAPLLIAPHHTATVGDVDRLARAASAVLAARPGGFAPGEVVALASCNGPGLPAALLALLRAGLPALLLDAQAPEAESLRIARSLGAATFLRCQSCWPAGAEDFALSDPGEGEAGPLRLPGIGVLKLTSGSTGTPRGVATPSAALVADDAALSASMGFRPEDRLLAAIPMSHSYGLSSLVLPALMRGTPLVVPEEHGLLAPFTAAEAAGATVFPTVPAYLEALLGLSHPPAWPDSLRLVIAAGEPLKPATARRFRETFGLPVHVFYGASESGGICYDRLGGAGERGTVGTPVLGVEVTLVPGAGANDDKSGGGREGRVAVRSAAVAAGYLPDADPRLADGRFLASDFAAWVEGELVLRGRLDDLINVKGKKVDPREVETVLADLPGVDEVAVLGVLLPERGTETVRAVIACRPGELSPEQVLHWCRGHLAAHKVPRSVILVPEMPRTARGKIDRRALLALDGGAGSLDPVRVA
ncbi:MAG: long-chain acyl-CoA synthetase [Acidobacteriota bacterium]|nr:long-chain acyl-CoA synthetase [Acidobacteriota bacterium]